MPIYVVQKNDSIDRIASLYQIPVETLIYDNQIDYPYRLAIGQALFIGTGQSNKTGRRIVAGGYAYPYIDEKILNETLDYITDLYVFSYGFTEQGNLTFPNRDDQWMIDASRKKNVLPYMTLTSIGEGGNFDSNLVHVLVNDSGLQQRLIGEILAVIQEKKFGGVDIDFEYILAEDRLRYVDFVRRMRVILNQFGYPVSVALAPKTYRNQPGLLYEGKDYKLLGEAANHVLLMTYEWGYTYGPPMAVAPVNKVREVVKYALTEIPAEKIRLGIPNYAYDWSLPFVKGTSKAQSMGNVEAVQRAIDFGAEIQFDPVAQTPYYHYWQYGIYHEVWFEDVRSMQAKFALIDEFGLMGAGYWQLQRLFRANWLLMKEWFQIMSI